MGCDYVTCSQCRACSFEKCSINDMNVIEADYCEKITFDSKKLTPDCFILKRINYSVPIESSPLCAFHGVNLCP